MSPFKLILSTFRSAIKMLTVVKTSPRSISVSAGRKVSHFAGSGIQFSTVADNQQAPYQVQQSGHCHRWKQNCKQSVLHTSSRRHHNLMIREPSAVARALRRRSIDTSRFRAIASWTWQRQPNKPRTTSTKTEALSASCILGSFLSVDAVMLGISDHGPFQVIFSCCREIHRPLSVGRL